MSSKKRRRGPSHSKKTSSLSKTLLEYIKGKRYQPLTLSELTKQLNVPNFHKEIFKEILDDLIKEGELALEKKKYRKPKSDRLKTGEINVLPKGFGFVRVKDGPDIFIPKPYIKGAVDGDTVEVELHPIVSPRGPEGKVVAILKRSRTHLAGTILQKVDEHYLAFAPLLGTERPVKLKSTTPLKEGDRIICKVLSWKTKDNTIEGEVTQVLGSILDPSIDIVAAIEEFELPDGFTKEAIDEAKSFGKTVRPSKTRKDLTKIETVTIDPKTAKDFDDAISLTKDERGHFLLGVHIADVAHYVKSGSFLDKEAFLRCNSTYFPGTCVPMLPEELSNELCSLKPKVKRLTQTVFAEFNPHGDLVDYSIEKTVIQSDKRFTYEEALEVLEGRKKSPYAPLLKRMLELCELLKKKRFERGSIDFSMPSNVVVMGENGMPEKIEKVFYDITHQMIEEFMLKANELVATHLAGKKLSLIYRVHEEPAKESLEDFYQFAKILGFELPSTPTRQDIQHLFLNAKNSPHLPQLSISFIRSMRLAAYSTDNLGHFGLALGNYCHFTSPIRRYTDLIVQRILFDEVPEGLDIGAIALACSEKERVSFRAETNVTLLKKLRLAKKAFEEDPSRTYEATITKVKPFAMYFDVGLFDLEGSVHVSEIGEDYFRYSRESMSFQGVHTGKSFKMGQKIWVRMQRVNFILLQSDWEMVSETSFSRAPKKRKERKQR